MASQHPAPHFTRTRPSQETRVFQHKVSFFNQAKQSNCRSLLCRGYRIKSLVFNHSPYHAPARAPPPFSCCILSQPMTNSFVSVPADLGQLNCAALVAGVIAGVLDGASFVSVFLATIKLRCQRQERVSVVSAFFFAKNYSRRQEITCDT